MTRSDNIKEFLKYASPRLEYIEHCMEKQALKPQPVLSVIKRLRNLDDKTQELYPSLKALSESKYLKDLDLATMDPKAQREAVKNALGERRKSKGLTKLKPKKGWEPPASKPKSKEKYEDLFDYGTAGTDYIAHLKTLGNVSKDAKKPYLDNFRSSFVSDPRVTQEATRRGITADALFDEVAKYYASGFRGAPGANARGLRRLFDDATDGKYYNYKSSPFEPVADWAKEHPVATPLIAAGLTNIPTAGISYAIGSNSGEERGVANADAYYRMLMAQQASALQNANGDLLSRLANVFGAGDLNKIIDGYYN